MAATLSVRLQTTASPGSQGPAQTGIDLESADNSLNTLANRQTNPITIPSGAASAFSFEKWLKLAVDVAPANTVTNFKIWSANAAPATGVTLCADAGSWPTGGGVTSYTTPVGTSRATAALIPTTSGAALQWDAGAYSSIAQVTKYTVLQLVVLSTASPGNVPQMTVSYSYDET
jgi:hypothetical protein